MAASESGTCAVCGKPGSIHLTEIRDGKKASRSLCLDHAPPELRDRMPFGPHRTPAEEAAFLRQQLPKLEQLVCDPTRRAAYVAEAERLIAEIEAGRRRVGDAG